MIDWERIEDLRREVGHKDFADVVALFFEEIDSSLPGSLDLTEPDEIRDLLHFIRGSALNLGFFELARLCEPDFFTMETGLSVEKIRPYFERLRRSYERAKAVYFQNDIVGSSLNYKLSQCFIICYVRICIAGGLEAGKKSFKTIGVFGFQSDQD